MANEIYHSADEARVLYALIWRKTDDKVYDRVAAANTFDTYTDADIATYNVELANQADSDYHSVDFPTGIAEGVYRIQIMQQDSDTTDTPHADNDVAIGQGEIYWDGAAEIDLSTITVDTGSIEAKIDTMDALIDQLVEGQGITHDVYPVVEEPEEEVILKEF